MAGSRCTANAGNACSAWRKICGCSSATSGGPGGWRCCAAQGLSAGSACPAWRRTLDALAALQVCMLQAVLCSLGRGWQEPVPGAGKGGWQQEGAGVQPAHTACGLLHGRPVHPAASPKGGACSAAGLPCLCHGSKCWMLRHAWRWLRARPDLSARGSHPKRPALVLTEPTQPHLDVGCGSLRLPRRWHLARGSGQTGVCCSLKCTHGARGRAPREPSSQHISELHRAGLPNSSILIPWSQVAPGRGHGQPGLPHGAIRGHPAEHAD